ncbi:MAG: hypothetical protein AAFO72_08990 [Pseudomonadota bacterium]
MKLAYTAAFMGLIAAPVTAAELATSAEIMDMIIGNTVEGGMSDGAAYAEFYSTDGAIKADGYSGKWSFEGDAMCFDYGEGADCFTVSIDGDSVTWMVDGEEAGTGTIAAGNPNAF